MRRDGARLHRVESDSAGGSKLRWGVAAALILPLAAVFLLPQGQFQVGYAILSSARGEALPVAAALFSYRNGNDVLVAEAGVAAVSPSPSGRLFVDQRDTRTGVAFANPGQEPVGLELTLRDAQGGSPLTRQLQLGPRQHVPQFVDELFEGLSESFVGTLTYRADASVAAVTLRQSVNAHGEPLLATLPVANLDAAGEPNGTSPVELILPHVGAGGGLTTRIILIERSGAPVRGVIRLRGQNGAPLTAELDGAEGSEFPFQLAADGVFVGLLDSRSGISQGWAVIRVESGTRPDAVAVFQFRDGQGRTVSEAGVGVANTTRLARLFVDTVNTRTGVALAAPGEGGSILFCLLDRHGLEVRQTVRQIPNGGQSAFFIDELFAGLPTAFTGLLEMSGAEPFVCTSLKLSSNQRGEPILTTLPVADLDREFPSSPLILPQIGFGVGFSTRLILISPPVESVASLRFRNSSGGDLTLPLTGSTGSVFQLTMAAGGVLQLRPGNSAAPAQIVFDPANPSRIEIVVNRNGSLVLRPVVIDERGEPRDDFTVDLTVLDQQIAVVDAQGRLNGLQAGFSTLTGEVGGVVATTTIAVVDVSAGAPALEISGIALDPAGRAFLCDSTGNTILRSPDLFSPPAVYAGSPGMSGLRDGRRLESLFSAPRALSLNRADGSILLADSENHAIRRVLPGSLDRVDTLAGTGTPGSQDGPARQASFFEPSGVALDQRGFLWVTDTSNHLIRRINLSDLTVQTVAGSAGSAGYRDGRGSQARFNRPLGIALELEPVSLQLQRTLEGGPAPLVTVIVADSGNNRLRRVREDGLVETVGGAPTNASASPVRKGLASPEAAVAVAVDAFGNIFSAGAGGVSVLLPEGERLDAAQAGTFGNPRALAIDGDGRVVVGDSAGTLRLVYGAPSILRVEPSSVSNQAGSKVTLVGRNFSPADTIVVVAGRLVSHQVLNTGAIELVLPALPSGRTTVTVQNRGGIAQAPILIEPTPLLQLPNGFITTVAGGGTFVGDGALAREANLASPEELAIDPAGNLYVADRDNHRVRRIDALTGVITTIAGTGVQLIGFPQNNIPAVTAQLGSPEKLAVDGASNVYISSFSGVGGIRQVESETGLIRAVPGLTSLGGFHQIVADSTGNIFVSESFESRVMRRDAATGLVEPYAGNGSRGFSGDGGPALDAELNFPQRMAVDSAGNLYIADQQNHRVRRVDAATRQISTAAMVNAGFGPENVALDAIGNLFVGGGGFFGLVKIDADTRQQSDLAPSIDSRFLAADAGGNVFYSDQDANLVFRVSQTGVREVYAGTGNSSEVGDGGTAVAAALAGPVGIATADNGDFYVADRDGQRIRRVEALTGLISTVAGTGDIGHIQPVDGTPALEAPLFFPDQVAVDGAGNVYFAESKIWRIDPIDRTLRTAAEFSNAAGLEVDEMGNLYFIAGDQVMRRDAQTGTITVVAGNGQAGFSGDGGPAVSARLDLPSGLAVDGLGNVFVADLFNERVRRIDAQTGIISTVAGGGSVVFGDNRPATEVTLAGASDVAVDRDGNLFILESFAIRRVDAATRIITTVARTRSFFNFDGDNRPATEASYDGGQIAVDRDGNIYLTDTHNGRVRAIRRP